MVQCYSISTARTEDSAMPHQKSVPRTMAGYVIVIDVACGEVATEQTDLQPIA